MKNKNYSIYPDFEYDSLWPADHQPAAGKKQTASFPWSERHLQCAWFSPELRPKELKTSAGERVVVEKPGRWNLEKGPDFLGAALLVGAERRRISGDIEVHIHPADWQNHGHAFDPAYARVIAHVTYFPALLPARELPAGAVQIALKSHLDRNPFFSFESIDVTAFPHAAAQAATPCRAALAGREPEIIASLFAEAGRYRIENKAERMASAAERAGGEQVLYEEVMSALGYKHNRLPFRQLAARVPLEALREESGLNCEAAYALLAGVAGLMPPSTKASWDDETRRYVRGLWNHWWKMQAKWSDVVMPPDAWRLNNVRPPNHPRRRLAAAAALFTGRRALGEQIAALIADNPRLWLDGVMNIIQPPADAYWRRRFAIGGKVAPKEAILVGEQRAAAIISNVIVPFALGPLGKILPLAEIFSLLPPEEDNTVIRQAALNLLGRDFNPALYRNGLLQQGLIQIFQDFCLSDRSNCAGCGLVKMIRNMKK